MKTKTRSRPSALGPVKMFTVTLPRTIEYTAIIEDIAATTQQEAIDKAVLYADSTCGQRLWREGDVIEANNKAKPQASR